MPTAWTCLLIEDEFGLRDEGFTVWPTEESAEAWKKAQDRPGAPGQWWFVKVAEREVTPEVAQMLAAREGCEAPYLDGVGLHLPKGVIDVTHVRAPSDD